MEGSSSNVNRINEILKEAISSIENSKEEIIEIVDHTRAEYYKIKEELDEIKKQADIIIKEVDMLEVEERKSRNYLSNVSKNFNIYNEEDIKEAYDKANGIRVKLLLKREEEKNLIKMRKDKEIRLRTALEVFKKAESVGKSVSVATEYLKGNLDEIIFTVKDLNKRQFLGIKIIEAQEEERHRLARDIHDGPAQSMVNTLVKAELCQRLMDIDRDKSKKELENLKKVLRSTLKDLRKIIYDLRPMSLDDLGLIPTMERYIYNFMEDTGIEVKLNKIGEIKSLEPAIEIAIFRIFQESLSNIRKHSFGDFANITIEFSPTRLNLSIVDNGVGFNLEEINMVEKTLTGGFGLMNIRERLELLGGKLHINSYPGAGTKLNIYIPLIKEESRDDE